MTNNQDDRWRFCGAFAGPRHESTARWECLVCGARFSNDGPPPAGIHPDARCPIGINAPCGEKDDEATIQ